MTVTGGGAPREAFDGFELRVTLVDGARAMEQVARLRLDPDAASVDHERLVASMGTLRAGGLLVVLSDARPSTINGLRPCLSERRPKTMPDTNWPREKLAIAHAISVPEAPICSPYNAKTGSNMPAVAVLDVSSVRKIVTIETISTIRIVFVPWKMESCWPIHVVRPLS